MSGNMIKNRILSILGGLLMMASPPVVSGHNSDNREIVLHQREKPTFSGRMIVGYYPSWGRHAGEPDYDKLSMICLAFAQMRGDGHLEYEGLCGMQDVIDHAHEKDVKVLVSLRDSRGVSAALADSLLRKNLAFEVKKCIAELDLDGVDVDYEEWGGDNATKRENLEAFYKDIRRELGDGYLITAALTGLTEPNDAIDARLLSHLDYVFPMIYDLCGGWEGGGGWGEVGQHSSYEYFKDAIRFFTSDLKVPASKLCAGLPFYGYEFSNLNSTAGAKSAFYRDILKRFPEDNAQNKDNVGLIWYNGIPTIKKKCKYVADEGIAGVMIWELSQDSHDPETSLLNAAYSALREE